MDDYLTDIKIEARVSDWCTVPGRSQIYVVRDPEDGWVRTYGYYGWQRFQAEWVEEHSRPLDWRDAPWLEQELLAKGYRCEVTTIFEI